MIDQRLQVLRYYFDTTFADHSFYFLDKRNCVLMKFLVRLEAFICQPHHDPTIISGYVNSLHEPCFLKASDSLTHARVAHPQTLRQLRS